MHFFINKSLEITYQYNNRDYGVCALWSSCDNTKYVLHKWEYCLGNAPKIFDIVLSKDNFFNVCKITGVDEIGTL